MCKVERKKKRVSLWKFCAMNCETSSQVLEQECQAFSRVYWEIAALSLLSVVPPQLAAD